MNQTHELIDNHTNTSIFLFYLIEFMIIVNTLEHFLYNTLGIGNIYYTNYILWLLLLASNVFVLHNNLSRKGLLASIILLITFLIGTLFGDYCLGLGFLNIHIGWFMVISYIGVEGFYYKKHISEHHFLIILKTMVFLGIVATAYMVLFQTDYMINVICGNNVSYNSWKVVSFFRQRNIFAEYCYFAAFAAASLFFILQKKIYLICVAIFGADILLTNSRAALLSYVLIICLIVCLASRNNMIMISSAIIVILMLICFSGAFNSIVERLYHTAGEQDSGIVRILMWMDCIKMLFEKKCFVFGFGPGSVERFLMPKFMVGSSHNSYIDCLFEGGLLLLFIQILSLKRVSIIIKRNKPTKFKMLYTAFLLSFVVYNFLEAGALLYGANYFSITSTIMLLLIPKVIETGGTNNGKE